MVILIHLIKHTAFNRENMKLQIKKIILLLLIGTTLINCSVEEDFVKMNDKNASPIVKTILYEQADETFNRLKSDLKIERYLKSNLKSDIQARTTMDTLGLTIVTDLIKQVTLGDYTSYTMEIVNQKDTIIFYNLTLEYKNGESSMFVTKYIPDEYWLNNKDEFYSGGIFSKRVNKLKVHTELDDLFADNSGGVINGNDLGLGGGAGGGSFNFQGTPTYPADCNGIVIVSIQAIPYPCGCENHMPWECNGCSESPAGYNYIPYYFCQDYGNGGGGNPPDSGGASGGGPSNPLNPNDNSIGAMIMPVECTKKIVGDLNGDCMLSPYEACLLSGNSQEVCDCVEVGGNLSDCQLPCPGNPLKNIELAPQFGASGSKGGMYGCTRYGGTNCPPPKNKKHDGLDLVSPINTSIHAMYDGVVVNVAYQEKGAGYYTNIKSVVNGVTIIIGYFHLRENILTMGQQVSQLQIIGYQGDSGNLKNAIKQGGSVSHLHLKIKRNGSTVDPREYLFTEMDDEGSVTPNEDCN